MPKKRKPKRPPGLVQFPNEDGYRVYAAYRHPLPCEETDQLVIWCDCGDRHIHGAAGKVFGSGDGGRAPHCADHAMPDPRPPYMIREAGTLPKEWRRYL